MTEHDFEKDGLISGLYNNIGKEKPSSDIDREILARAYEMKPVKSGSPFSGGWKVPLSLAAVLVVGLAVVLRLGVSPKQPLPEADQAMPKLKKEQVLETESVPQTATPEKARLSAPAPMVEMKDNAVSPEVHEQKQKPMVSDDLDRASETTEQSPVRRMEQAEDKIESEISAAGAPQKTRATEPSKVLIEEAGKASDESTTIDSEKLPSTDGLDQHLKSYGSMEQFLTPEYWKQEISLLILNGEIKEAQKQLQLFKEAFPDYDATELEALFIQK